MELAFDQARVGGTQVSGDNIVELKRRLPAAGKQLLGDERCAKPHARVEGVHPVHMNLLEAVVGPVEDLLQ